MPCTPPGMHNKSCTKHRNRKLDAGETPVHWVIHLDPAGQHNLMKRCKHVNLVSSSNVDGKEEFLLAP